MELDCTKIILINNLVIPRPGKIISIQRRYFRVYLVCEVSSGLF